MEGDAGAGPVTPVEAQPSSDSPADRVVPDPTEPDPASTRPRASRLGGRGALAACAALLLAAAGLAAGGYLSSRYHQQSLRIDGENAAAVAAAKECVLVTQAPDAANVAEAERKIFECSTGDFRTQYMLYSGVYVQAYRDANVKVQVSELRAAVERDNDDGSIDVLVALRIRADNIEAQGREFGYRLRAQMALDDGRYRIAKLDQVAR